MRFHCFFPTVKTAAFYLSFIKRYLKNIYPPFLFEMDNSFWVQIKCSVFNTECSVKCAQYYMQIISKKIKRSV